MQWRRRTVRGMLVGAIALATLSACGSSGKDETPTPIPTPSPVPATVAPTAPPQIDLGEVTFAVDADPATGGPAAPTQSFVRSTQTVRAFVQSSALPAGTMVRADWAINGVAVPTLMQEYTLSAERPAGWIEFSLDRSTQEPWPSGTLTVTVTVDGTSVSGDASLSGF